MEQEEVESKGLMDKLKEDNPNANWKNLVTGVVILILVVVFSVWYFSSNPGGSNGSEAGEIILNGEAGGEGNEVGAEGGPKGTIIVVQKGEGLWQIAKRVCGDGEKYNHLARANGLNIWNARVAEGQELVLDCGAE